MDRVDEVVAAILLSLRTILLTLRRLFQLDNATRIFSVELLVLLTTLLLVVRFVIDFKGPWFAQPGSFRMTSVLTLEMLNQSMVIYTMGLMQLSGTTKVNDYFQVWAVLLVTLQYSVKIGRPYTRSKQIPLLDLMSSLWSANLLRVQTFYLLRIPLWTIWSLNAVRIVVVFVSSTKGETNNQESMRLLSDYMSYEDTLSTLEEQEQEQELEHNKKSAMSGYKYLVYGEHRVLKEFHEGKRRPEGRGTVSSCFRKRIDQVQIGSSYKVQLYPDGVHKEQLVTIETIWSDSSGSELLGVGERADPGNQRKDLCLSFALYKLLRRRFYHLPMHELYRPRGKEKMRRLVFDYVLEDRERAFRITGTELSFIRDLLYSKHATVFAGGLLVPLQRLLLSLCLATATGYLAYTCRHIPERMDPADRNRITHGVFITRLMVATIVLKEVLEIILYLCSCWAKVLILCKYIQHPCLQRPVVEGVMRFMLWFGSKAKWSQTVRQQNLLLSPKARFSAVPGQPNPLLIMLSRRGAFHGTTGLKDYMKDAILAALKNGEEDLALDNYFPNSFRSIKEEWPCCDLKVDTHIILVWHIATCLCEIYFFDKVKELSAVGRQRGPFMEEPEQDDESESDEWSEQYATAVTLSNYCVYLLSKALVPDNRLVARKVLDEVIREIDYVIVGRETRQKLVRSMKLEDVYKSLMKTVDKPCSKNNPEHHQSRGPAADVEVAATPPGPDHQVEEEEKEEDDDDDEEEDDEDLDIGSSLTRMGAVLGKKLTEMEVYHGNPAGLWKDLANFWTGFLLHLAANTGAATHGRHLAGDTELITHLWALLTHAGYRGNAVHGEQGLDLEDILDIHQQVPIQ